MFLEILQVTGKNFFPSKETLVQAGASCEFCEISKKIIYYKTALLAASDSLKPF